MSHFYIQPSSIVVIHVEYGLERSQAVVDLQTHITTVFNAKAVVVPSSITGLEIQVLSPDGLNVFSAAGLSNAPVGSGTTATPGTVLGSRP
jgi:hypothetical protein